MLPRRRFGDYVFPRHAPKERRGPVAATSAAGMALGLISVTALPAAGQATTAATSLPRTPDGHPDLQGTYDLATMTPLERLPGDPPFLTKEKAVALEKAEHVR